MALASNMKKHSAKLGILLGILISAGLLYYVLSGLEWDVFFREIKRINLLYLPVLFLLYLLSSWIRAMRWRYLLPKQSSYSTLSLFNACVIGNVASYALPLRAGEFIRPWVLSRSKKVGFGAAFASIVTERVFDVVTMLSLLGICLSQIQDPPTLITVGAKFLSLLAGVIILVMGVAYFRSDFILRLCEQVCSLVFAKLPVVSEKIQELAKEFILGLRAISSFRELLAVFAWSWALWLEFALVYHVMILSFGESPSLWVAQVLNVIIALAIAAPSAPGFLGTFQFGCVTALHGIYHYSQEFAVAYSIFSHSIQVIFTIFVGIFSLRSEGLRFGELSASRKAANPEESSL